VDTALAIARAAYPGKIKNAVLATADNYPDALAGSTLAYQLDTPILLVDSSEAEQAKVLDYLKANLEPEGTVYILGGAAVVSNGMENKIKSSGFGHITRIGGETRYDTAVKIAEHLNVKIGTPVVLISGENYPDALSVSSIAAQNQFPLLLVPKDGINDAVSQEIVAIKPGKIYIIGLEGAISPAVESQAAGITALAAEDIVRIGGTDRYATSLTIAQYFSAGSGVSVGGTTICIATGNNFPDALAGSIYAAKRGAPIILADGSLSEEAVNYLESLKVNEAAIFGGTGAVSQSIEQKLRELTKK
jgi:putative cell wall-binding protein